MRKLIYGSVVASGLILILACSQLILAIWKSAPPTPEANLETTRHAATTHTHTKRDGSNPFVVDYGTGELSCERMTFDSNRGPMLGDILDWLEDNKYAAMPYIIDKASCFQVACLGERGIVKLCNLKSRPSYMRYSAADVRKGLTDIMVKFRRWHGHLNWLRKEPEGYPPKYWEVLMEGSCGDTFSKGVDVTTMDRVIGEVSGDGWRINIDEPPNSKVCDNTTNFRTGACREEDMKLCSWPYEEEIPLM
ncbi:hypothetical protein DRE_05233 [Drechslerella stenobrocha 248]|uniref:Uncharacterized protein n=1 Tax=Drechslerella stenobrocha 248 TaxID=1043628 RepID=W7HZM6_9PEZI|nr:hypothetical protein DRE_05233 [Drechslerella stenobrocha 248]